MVASGICYRHEADESNPCSYYNVLSLTYKTCLQGRIQDKENLQQLANWLEVGTSRRGLEQLSVHAIKKDRRTRCNKAILTVLEAQTRFDSSSAHEKTEGIRMIYGEITKPARLFAIALADADELASQQDRRTALLPTTDCPRETSKAFLNNWKNWSATAQHRVSLDHLQQFPGVPSRGGNSPKNKLPSLYL